MKRLVALILLSLSACSFDIPSEPPRTEAAPYCEFGPPLKGPALAAELGTLPVREEPLDGYDRKAWGRWRDFDGDCQDTRAEALLESSLTSDVQFSNPTRPCTVVSGRWECPYTLDTFTSAGSLDLDHVVPLRTMFEILGRNPRDKWEAIELEADFIEHGNLLIVHSRDNRSKGSRNPANWLPTHEDARCEYVINYGNLYVGYSACFKGAAFSDDDRTIMVHQAKLCAAGGVPAAPQIDGSLDVPPPETCCKICRSSQACGDSCISRSKVCTKLAGCACQSE